eukprot:scaffold124981_cov78-Phaeocystis_antarctica.AAC.2
MSTSACSSALGGSPWKSTVGTRWGADEKLNTAMASAVAIAACQVRVRRRRRRRRRVGRQGSRRCVLHLNETQYCGQRHFGCRVVRDAVAELWLQSCAVGAGCKSEGMGYRAITIPTWRVEAASPR